MNRGWITIRRYQHYKYKGHGQLLCVLAKYWYRSRERQFGMHSQSGVSRGLPRMFFANRGWLIQLFARVPCQFLSESQWQLSSSYWCTFKNHWSLTYEYLHCSRMYKQKPYFEVYTIPAVSNSGHISLQMYSIKYSIVPCNAPFQRTDKIFLHILTETLKKLIFQGCSDLNMNHCSDNFYFNRQ